MAKRAVCAALALCLLLPGRAGAVSTSATAAILMDADSGRLLSLGGTLGEAEEEAVTWQAVSPIMHYGDPDHKYLSRFNLRLSMEEGARLTVSLRYDSQGEWEEQGSISFTGTDSAMLPIRPRRCDHLQLRLEGQGQLLLYSIARIYEEGSDEG